MVYIDNCVREEAKHLREEHIKSRFHYAPDEWPPYHPKHYTTLALIHHKGRHANAEVISVAQEMVASGNISKNQPQPSSISYHSKDVSELFPTASTSYLILIEGAPGIGKTVLSKEIAYQWAENKLLPFKKLVFLLLLRDPNLKNMVILENLTQYLCNSIKRGSELSEYLLQTEGRDITMIFDGYDEMSEEDRHNSLIAKIISRKVLPKCDLVITSRPTASLHLRDMADCRVEVLGFTEEDRLDYIQHALEGSNEKIEVLRSYLQSNSTINALCYVPLNMTILLCLYEDINLPKNTLNVDSIKEIGLPNSQTEMYEKFILMTITRCIKRNKNIFPGKYLKISELPESYNEIFNELLQLAYYALTKDKIVFTSDEEFIQQFCKNLKSGNCEGLGLLKVTEHATSISFHFLHFSIQEYLAAYYIASQPERFQVDKLRDTFWDIHYFNTWIMYVGITGGKRIAWKHYLSGNRFMLSTKVFKSFKISKSLLNDKIKSLHLFQCFSEIGNKELAGKIFEDKIIDLSNQTLLPRDINTLCFFLLRSTNKHWIKMDLSNCNIGSIGSDVLYKTFLDKHQNLLSIDKVDFSINFLQHQSILKLLDVVKFWHASEVIINEDCDYDNLFKPCLDKFSLYSDEDSSQSVLVGPFLFAHKTYQQRMYNQLTNSSKLTGLYLNYFNYQIVNSKFQELIKHATNLTNFHVIGNNLTAEFLVALVETIKEVDSIYICDNTLSDKDVNYISSSILYKTNSTTSGIWIVIGSTKILGNVHNNFTLNNKLSPAEIFNLTNSIRRLSSGNSTTNFVTDYNKHYSIFEVLQNSLFKNATKCDINFCMIENNMLIANGVKYSDLSEALSLNDQLISVQVTTCNLNEIELESFVNLISKQKSLQRLYIFDSLLEPYCFKELCDSSLTRIPWLKELLIHSTNSSCILTADLLAVQKGNTSVLLLVSDMLVGWNPTSRQLSLTLQLQLNITAWKLPNCHIDVQAFYQLAIMLSGLSELDISGCNLAECELKEIMQCNKLEDSFKNLTKLNISGIKITHQAFMYMANMLSSANKLNDIVLSYNNLLIVSASKLLNGMDLIKLDISFSAINNKTAHDIAKALCQSINLEELNISSCHLQSDAAIIVFKGMKSIINLSKFNVSHNGITDEAANHLAEILSQNVGLKELDLSYNCLHATGAMAIFRGMASIFHLTKLDISHNNITDEIKDDLGEILSKNVKLTELDFSYNCLHTAGAITILKGLRSILNLSKLNIGHNNITDEVKDVLAEVLSQNVGLTELDISYNHLQTAGAVTVFKGMDSIFQLSKFSVSHNAITDKAADLLAEILSQNVGLKELDLSCNSLQATGTTIVCKGMNKMKNLIKLNISNNDISSEAAHDIAVVLSHNTSLEELDFSCNNFGASGTARLFLSMKSFTRLITLNAGNIRMTDFAADIVANVLNNNSNLKELDLSNNKIQAVGAMEIFKNTIILSLNKLNISHNNISDQGADNIATFISQNTELQELDLSHNNLQAAGAVKICRTNISKLIKFNIGHNTIITTEASNDMAAFISLNNKLQLLDLSYSNLGFVSTFKNMQSTNNLSVLKIVNCYIISEAAKELATLLQYSSKLTEIDLSHNNLSTTDAVKIFKGMKSVSYLVSINISHNMISDEAAGSIANVLLYSTKLKELDLSHNYFSASGIVKIFQEMKKVLNLIALNVSHNMITDEAAESITTVLSHNSNLQTLNVSSNYLRSAGCAKILSGLNNMKCLTKLDISCNNSSVTSYLSSELNFVPAAGATIFKAMENISSLRNFILANIIVNDAELDDLGGIILQNNKLKELDINSNYLQTEGTIKIVQNIKHIKTFTKLNIAHNMITDEATEYIAAVLSNCKELVELNLSHNDFHNMGALCIPVSNLTKINFSNNNINKRTVNELSVFLSHCTNLEELNLANNNLQTTGAIKLFKTLTFNALKIISISGNWIEVNAADNIAISLSDSNKLQEIDLSCNDLQIVGINKILASINISNLTNLNISNNKIKSVRNFIRNIFVRAVNLVALNFSYNGMCLAEVNQCCSSLVQLNMCNSGITDEAAPALGLVLSSNSKLQEVDISYNNLKAKGIRKTFKKLDNLNLTKLNISNNAIDENAADMLGKFLSQNKRLKELDVSYNQLHEFGTKALCKRIANLSKLTKLKVGGNDFTHLAANDVAKVLLHNINLEEIDISDNTLLAVGAVSIFSGMNNIFTLRNVNISHNWITCGAADNIAAVLSQNTHLRKVYLAKNYLAANGIITLCRGMSNIQYLTHLDMSWNKITDKAAHDIATFLYHNPELEVVDLSNNLMQTPGVKIVCKAISTLKNLKTLNFSNNSITDEAAEELAIFLLHSTSLQGLDLSYNNISMSGAVRIFKAIRYIKNLTIDISHNAIPNETTDKLATMMLHNTSLRVLDISNFYKPVLQSIPVLNINSNVINEIISELVITLLNSTELKKLDVSYNCLSTSDAVRIFKGMKNISNLTALNISHNLISDEAADELAIVLLRNTNLEKLNLGFNDLSTSGFIKIFKGMKNISNLKTINIYSNNMITDEAADSIATVLSHNSKLKRLDMSFNYLGSKTCIEIFNGMKNISYLSHLNISHSKIAGEATGSIAAVLSHNTKIEELDISYNDLQTPGAIEVLQSIKHTSTLKKLNIAHNRITEKATEDIINILYKNTELKALNVSDNSLLEKDVIVKLMVSDVHEFNNSVNKQISKILPKIITNLQELDLSNISSPQAIDAINVYKKLIHNSALTKVNISGHCMTQSAVYNLENILSMNKDLQELVMSYNNLQTGDINTILSAVKSSNLTKLNISGNNANLTAVVNILLQYTNLVELDLSHNRLHDAADVTWGFSFSKNIFINLIKLNISGIFCEIISNETAASLAYIFSQNNKLNELDVSNNHLYSEAASKILNSLNASTLIKFRISHNNITDEVADDIADFLCKCTNLEELDLSFNSLQDSGATKISRANISSLVSFNISHNNITIKVADDVANFLSRNSQMQTFDLSCNGLLETGVRHILKDMRVVQSIFNLSVLNISEGSVISETVSELVTVLLCNTELKEFDLSCNSLFIPDSINILQGMKNVSNLVAINLSHTYITDEAADELATVLLHNTSLQKIDLSYNDLSTSDAMKIFKGMKNISRLEIINISHNMITDEAADELATVLSHNNDLEIFDVSSNCFSSKGCIKIMNGMSNTLYLKKIDISCNQITHKAADSIATFLSHSSILEELILSHNDFQKYYLFEKIKSKKLTKFNISFTLLEVDDIATVLMHNTELEDLDLSNNELLSDGIVRICLTMKNILNLKRIDISHNWTTGEAADDIANVLSQNTNLQELYLSNNYLQSHGIVTMFNKMSTVSKLTHLDISSNKITDEAADAIADFLLHNSNLKVLDLSDNLIQAAGTRIIFRTSNTKYSLKKLNVSLNVVDDEAADVVASFLSQNPSLEEFDVSKNYLQAVGAVKIFKAIQNCPNICKVNMSNNRISDEAGDEIAYVLSTVTKLREVDLDCNLLSAKMSDYIKRVLPCNYK